MMPRYDLPGAISFLITGDEEGPSVNGTKKMLPLLAERGERFDACIVGEPTNPDAMGDMIKIGRRGSLNGVLTVNGIQGHVAYPERADNPVHNILPLLNALVQEPLDDGHPHPCMMAVHDPANDQPGTLSVWWCIVCIRVRMFICMCCDYMRYIVCV